MDALDSASTSADADSRFMSDFGAHQDIEQHCHFCGVIFGLCRSRRLDEMPLEERPTREPGTDETNGMGCRDCWSIGGWREYHSGHLSGGLSCTYFEAYSGHRISVEEFEGNQCSQVIVAKDSSCLDQVPAYRIEDGDEEFEKTGACFLSEVAHKAPSGVSWRLNPTPHKTFRHEIIRLDVAHWSTGEDGSIYTFLVKSYRWTLTRRYQAHYPYEDITEEHYGIPIHPRCFEIYKKLCIKELGEVDIDSIWELRYVDGRLAGNYTRLPGRIWEGGKEPEDLPRADGIWAYAAGDEYLAANPIRVPRLAALFDEAARRKSDPSEEIMECIISKTANSTDAFLSLSNELLFSIMTHLTFRDVTNLQLVSRAFRPLPNAIFKAFIQNDMPYIWEIHGSKGLNYEWLHRELTKARAPRDRAAWPDQGFDPERDPQILGLMNRERIWKRCEEKVGKVKAWRAHQGLNGYDPEMYVTEEERKKERGKAERRTQRREERERRLAVDDNAILLWMG